MIREYTINKPFHEYFSRYRTTYRNVIRAAKECFHKVRLNTATNKSKESWTIINELRGKTGQATPQFKLDPNVANNYYCTIGTKLTGKIGPHNDPLDYLRDTVVPGSFCLFPTGIIELKDFISDIKNKKSSGINNLSVRMTKNIPDSTLNILVHLINQSFESGIFPSCLKTANVIPLYKGEALTNSQIFDRFLYYALSKIIEKLVKKKNVGFFKCS